MLPSAAVLPYVEPKRDKALEHVAHNKLHNVANQYNMILTYL